MNLKELQIRTPGLKAEWLQSLKKIGEHPHAPRWNTSCGDRLEKKDLIKVTEFAEKLAQRAPENQREQIFKWVQEQKAESWWFQEKLADWRPKSGLEGIPCMTRSHLQHHLEEIVPFDLDLERLIVNPTSGTTGQPILCPNHPVSIGCYDAMGQFMLSQHGVQEVFNHHRMAAIQLCAQQNTITYYTLHSWLNGAGFAKINILPEDEWPKPESVSAFIHDMNPVFLTGDPIAFYRAMEMGLNFQPQALVSTAITLGPKLRIRMESDFQCPVINFYSLNETGPIAYSCPDHPEWMHILPHDIYVETLDDSGKPVGKGEQGEVTVTGGRNPYLPLLRYRTGDRAVLNFEPCTCGDSQPRLKLMEARRPILFCDQEGRMVNPIDINRILRQYPVQAHQMIQNADRSCTLLLNMASPRPVREVRHIHQEISALFRDQVDLTIHTDREFSPSPMPYTCEVDFMKEVSE